MIIDSHAHLNFHDFDSDRNQIIQESIKNGVGIINVGSNYNSSLKAVEIAIESNNEVYASVGLHPIYVTGTLKNEKEVFNLDLFKKLASNKKVVAVGEIGLDYYSKPKNKNQKAVFKNSQKNVFIKQMELAEELNLPVILHCRMAHSDLIDILKNRTKKEKTGVVHCFTGSWQDAQEYLEQGYFLGFTGIIFKMDMDKIIEKIPLNRILVETDCPYLTPPPFEGRNLPIYVKEIVKRIALIKETSLKETEQTIFNNTKKLFNI